MPKPDPRVGETSAAILDRMCRNTVPVEKSGRAGTPVEVIFEWADGIGFAGDRRTLIDLAERLRDASAFAEDGMLVGLRLVEAVEAQSGLYARDKWPAANKLRFLANRMREVLGGLGLL